MALLCDAVEDELLLSHHVPANKTAQSDTISRIARDAHGTWRIVSI